ncbi:unnamed protein product, partial [Ilex paraguariensis]
SGDRANPLGKKWRMENVLTAQSVVEPMHIGGGCGCWWRMCSSLVEDMVAGGRSSDGLPRRRVAEGEESVEGGGKS